MFEPVAVNPSIAASLLTVRTPGPDDSTRVQLGLLLRRHLDKGYAHSESVAPVDDFAGNLQHFVVMGKTKPKPRAFGDGIQCVDISAEVLLPRRPAPADIAAHLAALPPYPAFCFST